MLMVLAAHMRTEPRRRGDAPPWCDVLPECFGRTPQARGCTGFMKKEPVSNLPNPAGAGMHRGINSHHPNLYSEPRRRGDAPEFAGTQDFAGLRTPQARGCTGQTIFGLETKFPNPAGAGMHRAGVTPRYSAPSEPRRRGDAPAAFAESPFSWVPNPAGAGMHRRFQLHGKKLTARTPQARGCTARVLHLKQHPQPNPAGAGMHRRLLT